jgi:hypothetical protein
VSTYFLRGHDPSRTSDPTQDGFAGRIRVSAIVVRTKQQSDPKYLERIQSDRWETVLCEVIVAPANGTTLH